MPGSDLSHDGGAVPPPVDPWDRRETEPEHSYEWFRAYLALGAGRTLDELADALDRPKHLLAAYRQAWDWDPRAAAWDAQQAESMAARRHAARDLAAGRAATAAVAAMQAAEEGLRQLDPARLGAHGVADLLTAGSTAARWALGDPSAYRPQRGERDPLEAIARDPHTSVHDRLRAAGLLERRDATEEAAESDRDIIAAVQDALAEEDPEVRARRVSAALAGAPVTEPGSTDDDRTELGAELDDIMRSKE